MSQAAGWVVEVRMEVGWVEGARQAAVVCRGWVLGFQEGVGVGGSAARGKEVDVLKKFFLLTL